VPKFLIIRFSSIGDIVLTSPVVRCLKEQVSGAEVHYLSKRAFEPVLRHNPYIDKLHLLEPGGNLPIRALRAEHFDAVIDLHHNQRSWWVKRMLGGKSHSFRKLNYEKWLLVNFKKNRLPDLHIVDRYLETVAPFGVRNDNKGLDYFIAPEDEDILSRLPAPFRQGYIALVIGARHATKRLQEGQLITLCGMLRRPVVLLGGQEDAAAAAYICERAGANVFNACGIGTLNESAALVRQAEAVITHDTGLMHIAAAYGKRIVSVWGNTVPAFGMSPYPKGTGAAPVFLEEVRGLPCRPCSKIGFPECPKQHFRCMRDQNLARIAANAHPEQ
jgi:ADP-heptose:LPS heptosyltransferase